MIHHGKSNIFAYSKARRINSWFCTQCPSVRDRDHHPPV